MPKLFKDHVILWLNAAELEPALAFARDFRCCSRTAMVGPNFFLAHGPAGVRCLYELGVSDVVLDLRLIGNPQEIRQCVTSVAQLGVKAVTISAFAGKTNLENALSAAEASKAKTGKVTRPYILVSPLPPHISDAEMVDALGLRVRHKDHIKLATQLVVDTRADGIIVDYEDTHAVRRVSRDVAQVVFAQKKPHNPHEIEAPGTRDLPSITEILLTKAAHVIFDSQLVRNTDVDWCADMMMKELANLPRKRVKTNVYG
jgi:orotidine-5'-phosphate decarboxylase